MPCAATKKSRPGAFPADRGDARRSRCSPRKRQRIRHAYGYAVAAALLAGVLVTALYLPTGRYHGRGQRYGRPQSYCPTEQGIRPYPIRTPVPSLRRPCPEQTPRSRYGPSRKQTERTPSRKDRLRPQDRRTPGRKAIRRARDAPPPYGRATETDSGAAAGNALPTPSPGSAAVELRRNTDAYWERAIAREYGGAPCRSVAGSVYAGNFGTFAGNSVTNGPGQGRIGRHAHQTDLRRRHDAPVRTARGERPPGTAPRGLSRRKYGSSTGCRSTWDCRSRPAGRTARPDHGLNYSYLYPPPNSRSRRVRRISRASSTTSAYRSG